jgi:hypothetical protein
LYIAGNNLYPTGAANLKLPKNLTTLDIAGNDIGPEGVANLKLPETLILLAISGNRLCPKHLQMFVQLVGYQYQNCLSGRGY